MNRLYDIFTIVCIVILMILNVLMFIPICLIVYVISASVLGVFYVVSLIRGK